MLGPGSYYPLVRADRDFLLPPGTQRPGNRLERAAVGPAPADWMLHARHEHLRRGWPLTGPFRQTCLQAPRTLGQGSYYPLVRADRDFLLHRSEEHTSEL